MSDPTLIWSEHARARLSQRGGKIGRKHATNEIHDAIDEGRTATSPPLVLDLPASWRTRPDLFYAWSPDLNRIYVLARRIAEITVVTVLRPTLEGRRKALRRRPILVPAAQFEGATADTPEDLPVPANAGVPLL